MDRRQGLRSPQKAWMDILRRTQHVIQNVFFQSETGDNLLTETDDNFVTEDSDL